MEDDVEVDGDGGVTITPVCALLRLRPANREALAASIAGRRGDEKCALAAVSKRLCVRMNIYVEEWLDFEISSAPRGKALYEVV